MLDNTDNAPQKVEDPPKKIDILQSWFNFARSIFLSVFLGYVGTVIVFQPKKINDWRTDAGIHEIEIGGARSVFEDAEKVLNNASTLNESNTIISALKAKIDKSNSLLKLFKDENIDPAKKRELINQIENNQKVTSIAQSVQLSIKQSLANNANIINKSQVIVDQTLRNWGIIIGADINIDAAKYEAEKAQTKGFSNINLYKKDKYIRTVIEFNSQDSANQNLVKAKKLNSGAYIVNLDLWCPQKSKVKDLKGGISVYVCS